jgi:aerobic carbon-monoxide dehydrogenase medium subunit
MKPSPFAYFAPRTLDEALALLAEHGSQARPLAGGQSLVQQMNLREVNPQVIVDLNRVPELAYLRRGSDGTLVIGAMTRQQRLVDDADIREVNPALTATANAVAFPAVRCRGTLGGSVANAEPGAQLPLLLTVLDAQATVARRGSQRVTPVSALFAGARATTLAPDELVIACAIPSLSPTAGYAIGEFRRGHAGPPIVSVVAIVEIDDVGIVSTARLGISGASEIPLRLREEEMLLVGRTVSEHVIGEVAELAAGRVEMGDQMLASVALRRRAARALLARALAEGTMLAIQRRRQEEQS